MPWPAPSNIDPCPHCGCDSLDRIKMGSQYNIACRICRLEGPVAETRQNAVTFWNDLQSKAPTSSA